MGFLRISAVSLPAPRASDFVIVLIKKVVEALKLKVRTGILGMNCHIARAKSWKETLR